MSHYSTKSNTPERQQKTLIFSIEGNIGAGKSTFLKSLNHSLKGEFDFYPENVSAWQDVANQNINLLDIMYKDPKRWGFLFQNYVMLTRLQDFQKIMQKDSAPLVFLERSLFSDQQIFIKNLKLNGLINEAEQAVYDQWSSMAVKQINYQIDGIVYLNSSPEVCQFRCNKRNRGEEKGIGIELLNQIDERHKEWLFGQEEYQGIPILEINTNKGKFYIRF